MKYFSLFSGIGGFEKAIQDSVPKSECVGYSEINKYAIQVYEKHFPNHKNYGDATTIIPEQLPDFDLLVGGFPCQVFSIAGKRRGFEDTRGTLFFDIARILKAKQPRNFILENVKGLLSHDNGNTFKTIISTLAELGYGVEWQVLNSKNFGVPQNRERVFIIGHLGGISGQQIFPIRQNSTETLVVPTLTTRYYSGQANGAYLRQISKKGGSQGMRVYDPKGIACTQASQAGGLGAKTGLYAIQVLTPRPKITVPAQWRRAEKGKEYRRESMKNGEDKTPFNGEYRELIPKDSDIIGTITSGAIAKDSLLFENMKIRRLTPVECERLQGFPDNWTDCVSDPQRYKCCGNAITVNVVQYLIKLLIK